MPTPRSTADTPDAVAPVRRPAPHRVDLHARRQGAVELAAYRDRHARAVRAAAAAPVRYVPAAFVEALQGSWGRALVPVER